MIFPSLESSASRKALFIGIVLVIVNQLCGGFAFISYTAEIFAESGSSLSSSTSAIIIAFIQLLGSVVSTLITEKMTRKFLYVSTCLGTIIGLLAFGVHGMLKNFLELSQFTWVPIVSMSFVIFIASVGLMPLTFTILSEILPLKVSAKNQHNWKLIQIWFSCRFEALAFHFARHSCGLSHFYFFNSFHWL